MDNQLFEAIPEQTTEFRTAVFPWRRAVVAFVLFVFSAGLTYGYLTYRQVHVGGGQPVAFSQDGDAAGTEGPSGPQPFTVALLGYGGGGHEGGLLTDSIMVVRVDPAAQKIYMISVPRDLWVPLRVVAGEPESYWKINAAYAIGSDDNNYRRKPPEYTGAAGGGAMSKDILATVLGFKVDRFVTVDFAGFMKAIDALGGIDVEVKKSFTDSQYPIQGREDDTCGKSPEAVEATATLPAHLAEKEFPCRFETLYFPKGVIRMDAQTALKYARSRHSAEDGGDFNRAARQRQVILAFKNKVLALNFVPKLIPLVNQLAAHLKTDLSLADMQALIERQSELLEYQVVGIALTTDADNVLTFGTGGQGQSIVIPKTGQDDWPTIHEWLQSQMASASAITDITPLQATTSAKVVDVVVSRPPETVMPLSQQDIGTVKAAAAQSALELKSTGDWSDTSAQTVISDAYGQPITDTTGIQVEWRISDQTLAELDPQGTTLKLKPQKTGESLLTASIKYQDRELPGSPLTFTLKVLGQ